MGEKGTLTIWVAVDDKGTYAVSDASGADARENLNLEGDGAAAVDIYRIEMGVTLPTDKIVRVPEVSRIKPAEQIEVKLET